jgi:hypothetical protein
MGNLIQWWPPYRTDGLAGFVVSRKGTHRNGPSRTLCLAFQAFDISSRLYSSGIFSVFYTQRRPRLRCFRFRFQFNEIP